MPRKTAVKRKRPAAKKAPAQCPPHPKRRVLKGLCGLCGRAVLDEKVA